MRRPSALPNFFDDIVGSQGECPGLEPPATLFIRAIDSPTGLPLGPPFRYPGGRHDSILERRQPDDPHLSVRNSSREIGLPAAVDCPSSRVPPMSLDGPP
jgi:hypothetical protein